jgi:hypothetical protein
MFKKFNDKTKQFYLKNTLGMLGAHTFCFFLFWLIFNVESMREPQSTFVLKLIFGFASFLFSLQVLLAALFLITQRAIYCLNIEMGAAGFCYFICGVFNWLEYKNIKLIFLQVFIAVCLYLWFWRTRIISNYNTCRALNSEFKKAKSGNPPKEPKPMFHFIDYENGFIDYHRFLMEGRVRQVEEVYGRRASKANTRFIKLRPWLGAICMSAIGVAGLINYGGVTAENVEQLMLFLLVTILMLAVIGMTLAGIELMYLIHQDERQAKKPLYLKQLK